MTLTVCMSLFLECTLPASEGIKRVALCLALSCYLWGEVGSKQPGPLCISILGRFIH